MNRKEIIYEILPFEAKRGLTAYRICEKYCARTDEDIKDSFPQKMSGVFLALKQMTQRGLIKRSVAFAEADGERVEQYVYSRR